MRHVILLVALVVAAALTGLAGAEQSAISFFRTPSGNIGCAYGTLPVFLRCDIGTGLRPQPPRSRTCQYNYGVGFEMAATGRAKIVCASDSVLSPSARVIPYGRRWRSGGTTCLSRRIGLRCTNRSGHGFFLSRQRSYRF